MGDKNTRTGSTSDEARLMLVSTAHEYMSMRRMETWAERDVPIATA